MTSTVSFFVCVSFLIINICILSVYAQLDSGPWPMFRGDVQHTGQSQYVGSQTGTLSWSYVTGDYVFSSPAIGSDGVAYVGSYDSSLYGLISDGSLLWSYRTGGDVDSSPAIGSDGCI